MDQFKRALSEDLKIEGGYVNHPNDPGTETNYGITKRTAQEFGYEGPMQEIPMDLVSDIYKKGYWDQLNLDHLAPVCYELALELFESAVNCGVLRVADWLSECFFIVTGVQSSYDEAVKSIAKAPKHGLLIAKMMNVKQGQHYMGLVLKNAKFRVFIKGWFKRIAI